MMATMSTARRVPSPDELTEIARAAVAHEHSVTRRLLGLPVRGSVCARIDAELARRGYVTPDRRGGRAA